MIALLLTLSPASAGPLIHDSPSCDVLADQEARVLVAKVQYDRCANDDSCTDLLDREDTLYAQLEVALDGTDPGLPNGMPNPGVGVGVGLGGAPLDVAAMADWGALDLKSFQAVFAEERDLSDEVVVQACGGRDGLLWRYDNDNGESVVFWTVGNGDRVPVGGEVLASFLEVPDTGAATRSLVVEDQDGLTDWYANRPDLLDGKNPGVPAPGDAALDSRGPGEPGGEDVSGDGVTIVVGPTPGHLITCLWIDSIIADLQAQLSAIPTAGSIQGIENIRNTLRARQHIRDQIAYFTKLRTLFFCP